MKTLSLEEISQALSYDPETGVFTYIGRSTGGPNRISANRIGTTAGYVTVRGYVGIRFRRRLHAAHRLAFLFMTGEMPEFVDHKDGDGTNNKWSNLRACTKSQNAANQGPTKRSTSGVKGVYLHERTGRWRAQIMANGRTIHLGYFGDIRAAKDAYDSAAVKLFGEFAKS